MFPFRSRQNDHLVKPAVLDRPIGSAIKAITWQIVGTVDPITPSYFVTGCIRGRGLYWFAGSNNQDGFLFITQAIVGYCKERPHAGIIQKKHSLYTKNI